MPDTADHFIAGRWIEGDGPPLASTDPSTGRVNWEGRAATAAEVGRAVAAARSAFESWAGRPPSDRVELVRAVAGEYERRKPELSDAICRETGKPRWEALAEVDLLAAKAPASVQAYERRMQPSEIPFAGATAATRFKPVGVVAVFGPFNMPAHLPNGHLIPAVLAGNAVVFKPGEQTPLVGRVMAEAWQQALQSTGAPPGLVNLVQGGPRTGSDLAGQTDLDGVFFTGSHAVGRALSRLLADHPEKILALEMGGNNPLIVHECADLDAAAYLTVQSAFVTAGQRCTCARRLIVPEGRAGDDFLGRLVSMIGRTRSGLWPDEPEPFLGTVISAPAADRLLEAQSGLLGRGAEALVEMKRSGRSPALLSPGLLDVTAVPDRADEELFGPLLQLVRVRDFDAAVREANRTRYGLAAGLLSDRRDLYEEFFRRARAGVVNWNRPLTGASGQLPFGGVGLSGNHRPAGSYAADYCSYPVASVEAEKPALPPELPPGFD